jgi:hypothetical protein
MRHNAPVLPPAAVCEILKACNQSGVREIEFHGLKVSFFATGATGWPAPEVHGEPSRPELAREIDQETLEHEALEAKEQELAELQITDPVEYERRMLEGDDLTETKERNEDG